MNIQTYSDLMAACRILADAREAVIKADGFDSPAWGMLYRAHKGLVAQAQALLAEGK